MLFQDALRHIEEHREIVAERCGVDPSARFAPIYSDYYVICESDPAESKVCQAVIDPPYDCDPPVYTVLLSDNLPDFLRMFTTSAAFDRRGALKPAGFVAALARWFREYLGAVRAGWRMRKSL